MLRGGSLCVRDNDVSEWPKRTIPHNYPSLIFLTYFCVFNIFRWLVCPRLQPQTPREPGNSALVRPGMTEG